MSQYNRRTLVRGAAWSIPVVAVAANAPAFAASQDAPVAGGITMVCRTTGNGQNGNCQGYRIVLNFGIQGPYDWDITITPQQVVTSNGATVEIKIPATVPSTVNASNSTMPVWFCSTASGDNLSVQVTYTARRSDLPGSTPIVQTFPLQHFTNISNKCS